MRVESNDRFSLFRLSTLNYKLSTKAITQEKNVNSRFSAACAAILALALGAGALSGCKPKEDSTVATGPGGRTTVATTRTTPNQAGPTAGNEVAEVKQMLSDMKNIKDIKQFPEYLTNESAAGMGMMMMIPVALVAGFEDMGGQFGQMNKQMGGQAQAPKMPKIKTDFEARVRKGNYYETK